MIDFLHISIYVEIKVLKQKWWLTLKTTWTDLAWEGCPIQRLYEVCVHLVGADDDGGHGLLVLQGGRGQKRESCQGDVVLDRGQTALIIAIWTQAAQKTERQRSQVEMGLSSNEIISPQWLSTAVNRRKCPPTWTPERRPRCRWQGRAPSGWRCVPTQRGSERAWLFQILCWWCWRPPACCSDPQLPCPGCFPHAKPRGARGFWTAADSAVMHSPEKGRFKKKTKKLVFKDASRLWATAKQCLQVFLFYSFQNCTEVCREPTSPSTHTHTQTHTHTKLQCFLNTTAAGAAHGSWTHAQFYTWNQEGKTGLGVGGGAVSTGFVQGTLEVGSLWSCCTPHCTQAKSVYLLTGAL